MSTQNKLFKIHSKFCKLSLCLPKIFQLLFSDQVHSIKNKWKTGEVEKAEAKEFSAKDEIEELRRGGTRVTERFREGQANDEHDIQKAYDKSELDTAGWS